MTRPRSAWTSPIQTACAGRMRNSSRSRNASRRCRSTRSPCSKSMPRLRRIRYADITDLRVRIPGRLINVNSGQAIGNFEVAYGPNDLPPLPASCNRDCILEQVGNQAQRIAADVGHVLAAKLDAYSPAGKSDVEISISTGQEANEKAVSSGTVNSDTCTGMTTGYTLTFRGFEPDEISQIEEYLVAFKGYDHHRPLHADSTETEDLVRELQRRSASQPQSSPHGRAHGRRCARCLQRERLRGRQDSDAEEAVTVSVVEIGGSSG